MQWYEFKALLSGLGPDTALGRIVAIRTEDDKDVLKDFTPEQKRIRSEWRRKNAKTKKEDDTKKFLEDMKSVFIGMAGGEANGG
jgi:hypothetical protein